MSDITYRLYFDQSVPSWKLEVEIPEGVEAPQYPFVYFGFYYPQDSGLSSSESPTLEEKLNAVIQSVSNQGYLRVAADEEFNTVATESQLGADILTDYRLRVGLFQGITVPSGSDLNSQFDDGNWDDVPNVTITNPSQYTESGLALPGYIKFRKATLSSNYPTYNLARKALDSVKSRLASLMGKYSSTQAPLSLSIRRISELRGDSTTTCYPGDSLRVEVSGGVAGYAIATSESEYTITDQNNIRVIKNTAGPITLSVQDSSGATKSLTLDVILPEDYTPDFVGDSL